MRRRTAFEAPTFPAPNSGILGSKGSLPTFRSAQIESARGVFLAEDKGIEPSPAVTPAMFSKHVRQTSIRLSSMAETRGVEPPSPPLGRLPASNGVGLPVPNVSMNFWRKRQESNLRLGQNEQLLSRQFGTPSTFASKLFGQLPDRVLDLSLLRLHEVLEQVRKRLEHGEHLS